jgi:sulfoxide reductase heme-binding subunit YedZ
MLLITASVFVGLTLSTRVMKGPGVSRWLASTHEQVALAGLVAIALHGVTLLGDPFLKASVSDIAVPFSGDFEPIWVGIGIVGGYLAALLGLTFYARRHIGAARWRKLHRLTLLAYALSVAHTLGAGTDFGPGSWPRLAVIAPVGPIAVLWIKRMRPAPSPAAAVGPARQSPA